MLALHFTTFIQQAVYVTQFFYFRFYWFTLSQVIFFLF